jgi:hypothetical protein
MIMKNNKKRYAQNIVIVVEVENRAIGNEGMSVLDLGNREKDEGNGM